MKRYWMLVTGYWMELNEIENSFSFYWAYNKGSVTGFSGKVFTSYSGIFCQHQVSPIKSGFPLRFNQYPASSNQHPPSSIQHPVSSIQSRLKRDQIFKTRNLFHMG